MYTVAGEDRAMMESDQEHLTLVKILLALANGIRAPLASSRETRPMQWLGYTYKTRLRGFQIP
ncbi:hypothetical protein [Nostoc sp. 106C]|uniref:hypothetical protein n=2 Tax=Nostoc sp. 106C TaxID=1932667 RepID=UPI00117CF4F4